MMAFTRGNHGTSAAYDRFYAYDEQPKAFVLRDFAGGVSTKAAEDHALSLAMNMLPSGNGVSSMAKPIPETVEDGFAEGMVRDHCYADGIWLFRKGRTLYAYQKETVSLVGTRSMLTAEYGAIYDIGGYFYVIDGEDVWAVGRDLHAVRIEQHIPVCFVDLMNDGITKTENEKPNPFCRYIDMIISEDAGNHQSLPTDIVYDREDIKVYKPDSEEEVSLGYWFIVDDSYIDFTGISAKGCRIRLKLLDSDDETKLSFSSTAHLRALLAESRSLLPYTNEKGVAFFLTWEGRDILLLERADDMLYRFSEKMLTKMSTAESITAIVAYADGYLLFTEHAVKKLYFGKNEWEEMIAQTVVFKQDFGSDMPGSVCGFDDKIIFASSRGGVFYINKFGITERDESRKVSENVESGAFGFFSHTDEEYRTARGFCAFGRYYLTVGAITYVWDHGAKLPTGAQSRDAEETMVWTLADGFSEMRFLREIAGRLYLFDGQTETLCYLTDTSEVAAGMGASLITSAQDLGVLEKKILTEVAVRYRADAPISVKLIFDGKESSVEYRLPRQENVATATLRVYAKKFEKVAAKLFCEEGFAVEAVIFRYL